MNTMVNCDLNLEAGVKKHIVDDVKKKHTGGKDIYAYDGEQRPGSRGWRQEVHRSQGHR